MSKIFGEEHFIDNTMIDIMEDYGNKLDRIVYDEMTKTIEYKMPQVKVDEQKLRDWIVLCMKLENIDKSDLVDIAVKKKFADKDEQLALYKRALELYAQNFRYDCNKCPREVYDKCDGVCDMNKIVDYFLDQAKKEMEEQNV